VMEPFKKMQVDLYSGMVIDSIIWRGKRVVYTREYNAVFLDLPKMLQTGSIERINVYYSGHPVDFDPSVPMYASFLWVEDGKANPWLQSICQGYGASGWWPNKDHLSDEPDSAAITITVPSGLNVVSNGRLRNKVLIGDRSTRYDWFVSYPINNYNLTLNVGDYKHFSGQHIGSTDTLDLDYYVLSDHIERAHRGFEIVEPMLKAYEKYFGPYPFPRDGFKLVETPHAMEHQSCVSIGYEYLEGDGAFDFENDSLDFTAGLSDFQIVLHESAHEWWGNSVSCKDNAELWIHESFATYAEALFVEEQYGYENSQAYLNAFKKQILNIDPIIGKFDVNHIHYDISDMYGKGALVLNTFRHVLNNDTLWFDILRGIQSTFQYQIVTTTDIIYYINSKTGKDYTYFFDQYLRFTDIPQLEIQFENRNGKEFLNYRWHADVAGFTMPVQYKLNSQQTDYLFPTLRWQNIELTNANRDSFTINEDQFYILVVEKY
jgi:aminopeptidase N